MAERQAKQAAKVVKEMPGQKKEKVKPVREKKEEEASFVNDTPKGHKKGALLFFLHGFFMLIPSFCIDMSQPMASGYNPTSVESAWYDWWESQRSLHSRRMKMDHLRMPVKALSSFPHRRQTLLGLLTLNTP